MSDLVASTAASTAASPDPEVCTNFIFDASDVLYVLQFKKVGASVNKNLLASCVKSVVANQRVEQDGSVDVQALDQTPILLFFTELKTFQVTLECLASRRTPLEKLERCQTLAQEGPKAVMDRVLPLYVSQLDSNLKFRGTVMRFEDSTAALYNGEPQVANEIECLVSFLFPEKSQK
jgi:hypothetical protein